MGSGWDGTSRFSIRALAYLFASIGPAVLAGRRADRLEALKSDLGDAAHAREVARLFEPLEYGEWHELSPEFRLRLSEAGHILGSAAIVLDIEEDGRHFRLWFSGDIGRRDLPILRDGTPPDPGLTLASALFDLDGDRGELAPLSKPPRGLTESWAERTGSWCSTLRHSPKREGTR